MYRHSTHDEWELIDARFRVGLLSCKTHAPPARQRLTHQGLAERSLLEFLAIEVQWRALPHRAAPVKAIPQVLAESSHNHPHCALIPYLPMLQQDDRQFDVKRVAIDQGRGD